MKRLLFFLILNSSFFLSGVAATPEPAGAAVTGQYRNLFKEYLGKSDAEIAARSKVPATSTTHDRMKWLEADLARAGLIRDLQGDLGVNKEGVGVILNLVDQIHSLRWALSNRMGSAKTEE